LLKREKLSLQTQIAALRVENAQLRNTLAKFTTTTVNTQQISYTFIYILIFFDFVEFLNTESLIPAIIEGNFICYCIFFNILGTNEFDATTQDSVFTVLFEWLQNTYAEKVKRHPERFTRWLTIRETCEQMLLAWGHRLKNIHNKPVAIARFSMVLLFHQCPFPIWNILSHLRLAFSVNTTKQLYLTATSIPIHVRCGWVDHNSIANVGADNMSYITYNSRVQINSDSVHRYSYS
jgi:hypothetical protein